jgi:SAM-dependent methyltransferase
VVSAYDRLGPLYDRWCRSVVEDVDFYVDLALQAGGPMLEIGVGSGRIAIPTALAGVRVVGVDTSPVQLALARAKAARVGVELELVEGDMRALPPLGRFPLVTVPFRAFLHLRDDGERVAVLRGLRERLDAGGTLAFDVFHPDREDIEETHARWIPRDDVLERALWFPAERRLLLAVRGGGTEAEMELWWADRPAWRRLLDEAGFQRVRLYGWFDRRPPAPGDTDSVWVAEAPAG